jgi:hypothetical protein
MMRDDIIFMAKKVYAAPWVELTHNGFYTFKGRLIPAP